MVAPRVPVLTPKRFGALIRAFRKYHLMTLAELARRVGVKPSRLHQWELGRAEPKLAHFQALMIVLGVDMRYLIQPADHKVSVREQARPCTVDYYPSPLYPHELVVNAIIDSGLPDESARRVALVKTLTETRVRK